MKITIPQFIWSHHGVDCSIFGTQTVDDVPEIDSVSERNRRGQAFKAGESMPPIDAVHFAKSQIQILSRFTILFDDGAETAIGALPALSSLSFAAPTPRARDPSLCELAFAETDGEQRCGDRLDVGFHLHSESRNDPAIADHDGHGVTLWLCIRRRVGTGYFGEITGDHSDDALCLRPLSTSKRLQTPPSTQRLDRRGALQFDAVFAVQSASESDAVGSPQTVERRAIQIAVDRGSV